MAARSATLGARLRASAFAAVVTLTDLLPPRLRYGYVHRATRALFARPLPSVAMATARRRERAASAAASAGSEPIVAALIADDLDVGGIGSVIEMLALSLEDAGVRPVVVCPRDGERAVRLRAQGVEVRIAADAATAATALDECRAVVAQLHSAPGPLESAALASGLPLVTAMHNTEIHFTRARWQAFTRMMAASVSGVAVSETVRDFHARHLPEQLRDRLVVIANGAPALDAATPDQRAAARVALGDAIGAELGDDVVFVCLARYDSQKNIAGAVAGFVAAASADAHVRLVFAGDPSDWAELRRAESLRDLSPQRDRVHFLGNSDAVTVLTAADAFLLDSFFEGWPVAATEAAAAGLPLVLSDMGGATELVGRDPLRSVLVPNPSGDAAGVSDRRVRAARRRSRHQSNAGELSAAVRAVAEGVRRDRASTGAAPLGEPQPDGVAAMARAHAEVLRAAAHSAAPRG